ncbi:hypothetical protein FQN57_000289 [Myotisia sp. PD_48]|nr:hypothetical protein FQN57_000289 [Myotisia sp. PD_48]
MEYVPSLCAAGTLGIAATGFALGQLESLPPRLRSSFQRRSRTSTGEDALRDPRDRALPPIPISPSSKFRTFTFDAPITNTSFPESRASLQDRQFAPDVRLRPQTQPADDKAVLRSRRLTQPAIPSRHVAETGDSQIEPTGRPSSSWLRRLSTITSSVYGSSVSGSRPQSPSVNSSTVPFFPQSPVTNNPPNKLVKRSASQRGFPPLCNQPESDSFIRRPATSHQRIAAMRNRSATESRVVPENLSSDTSHCLPSTDFHLSAGDSVSPSSAHTWRPYFRGIGATIAPLRTRRRSASVRQRQQNSPPRLVVKPNVPPTLILASSITPNSSISTPITSEFRSTEKSNLRHESRLPESHESNVAKENRQQPPFLGNDDFVEKSSLPWEESLNRIQRRRQTLREKGNEQPTEECARISKSERLNGNSLRVRRRKDITDPDIFQRPNTSYQPHSNSRPPTQVSIKDNPKPRLRHSPNFTDLRCEVLNERKLEAASSASGSRQSSGEHKSRISQDIGPSTSRISSFSNQRHSANSDPASTIPGSDNDTRIFTSGDEDETDFQSDTAFDSFPTRAASSKSNRGPRIDTIFDHPDLSSPKLNPTLLEEKAFFGSASGGQETIYKEAIDLPTSHRLFMYHDDAKPVPSKVAAMPIRKSARSGRSSPSKSIKENLSWPPDAFEDDSAFAHTRMSPSRSRSSVTLSGHADNPGSRMSLFDWSEQRKPSKDSNRSGYRPGTAHEKKLVDPRGGRSASRTAPNSLHLRSQSVPIAKDTVGSKDANANFPLKFGTWGLGNKGPTEDWDNDFDFEDSDQPNLSALGGMSIGNNNNNNNNNKDKPRPHTMKVPQAILDRQASVHGQYGHVQELTVLVEELKRLQVQAKALQIIDGPSHELWSEARGIINLATFDEEDGETEIQPNISTSHSSSCIPSEFGPSPNNSRNPNEGLLDRDFPSFCGKNDFDLHLSLPLRPRAESSTKARYVLDSIQQLRETTQAAPLPTADRDTQFKFAFDTQSLRDLVIRAGVLTRALKDIVRKAEGVYIPPEFSLHTPDPPFSQIFVQPSSNASTRIGAFDNLP